MNGEWVRDRLLELETQNAQYAQGAAAEIAQSFWSDVVRFILALACLAKASDFKFIKRPYMYLYSLDDAGGVILEWSRPGVEVDVVLRPDRTFAANLLNLETDVEEEFGGRIGEPDDVARVARLLERYGDGP